MDLNSCTRQLQIQAPSFAVAPGVQILPPMLPFTFLPMNVAMTMGDWVANSDQLATDSHKSLDDDLEVMDDTASSGSSLTAREGETKAEKEMRHNRNKCTPCFYFTFRADGCWKGDDCEFCHLCTKKEARRKEKDRAKATRRANQATGINASVGNPVVSSE